MKRFKILMFALSLVILLGIILYANPALLVQQVSKSDYKFIAVAFVIAFATIMLGVLKWKVMLKGVSFMELFPIQLLGFTISNFTPGKAAEPAKAVLLKISKGIPVSSSLASIIWERLADIFALVIFSLVAVSSLSVSSNFYAAGVISMGVFGVIIIISVAVLFNRKFGTKVFRLLRKLPLLKRLPENFMDMFYEVKIKRTRLATSFLIALFTWAIEGLVLYFILVAFSIQVNPLVLSGIVALSIVIGIASSLPGGLGTTEVVMSFLLKLNGVESGTAIASVIIFRFMTIWLVNLLGGISFLYLSKKFEIKNIF